MQKVRGTSVLAQIFTSVPSDTVAPSNFNGIPVTNTWSVAQTRSGTQCNPFFDKFYSPKLFPFD